MITMPGMSVHDGRNAHPCRTSPFTRQARRTHPAESRSSSYGLVHHLRLLPTPPRGGAVIVSFRPESVCLERTCTSLDVCAWRRTGPACVAGRDAQPESTETRTVM